MSLFYVFFVLGPITVANSLLADQSFIEHLQCTKSRLPNRQQSSGDIEMREKIETDIGSLRIGIGKWKLF